MTPLIFFVLTIVLLMSAAVFTPFVTRNSRASYCGAQLIVGAFFTALSTACWLRSGMTETGLLLFFACVFLYLAASLLAYRLARPRSKSRRVTAVWVALLPLLLMFTIAGLLSAWPAADAWLPLNDRPAIARYISDDYRAALLGPLTLAFVSGAFMFVVITIRNAPSLGAGAEPLRRIHRISLTSGAATLAFLLAVMETVLLLRPRIPSAW
jgi:hypothetical protein